MLIVTIVAMLELYLEKDLLKQLIQELIMLSLESFSLYCISHKDFIDSSTIYSSELIG